ncbi:MAG TPA: hypothetical protein VK709_04485 [Candidatus Saccharimonadales bacterium]|nr:hypothetical protein [Candidatus Saccharimonadales bacterium]
MGESKRRYWFGVAAVLLIMWLIVPKLSVIPIALADFVTPYIPIRLAPLNWALCLILIAVCQGPLLMPKYLSIPLNVLWAVSVLFLLGSWRFHPIFTPIIGVVGYIEMNWLMPLWEAQLHK